MGQFKPMVKMMTTEPSVILKLKKGGKVAHKMDGGYMPMQSTMPAQAMPAMPARGGLASAASPMKPSMAARRKAMMAKPAMSPTLMKKGGKTDKHEDAAQDRAMIKKAMAGKKFATGGVVNGQGGFKKGGDVKMASGGKVNDDVDHAKSGLYMQKDDDKVYSKVRGLGPGMAARRLEDRGVDVKGLVGNRANPEDRGSYKSGGIIKSVKGSTKMSTAKPDHSPAKTGGVKEGNGGGYATGGVAKSNAGGYKKGGATKKFARGGAVQDDGAAVEMPQGNKRPARPVSINQLSGTYKKGGSVKKYDTGGAVDPIIARETKRMEAEKAAEKADNEATRDAILGFPKRVYEGVKGFFTSPEKKPGSVTKTEKSVTVSPAKKRGGSVEC